ncbi:hypothetical protein YQE_10968, partial [Dendroctonus ponderosae]
YHILEDALDLHITLSLEQYFSSIATIFKLRFKAKSTMGKLFRFTLCLEIVRWPGLWYCAVELQRLKTAQQI